MRLTPTTRVSLALTLLLLAPSAPAATWELAPDTPAGLELTRDRAPALKISLSAWGPNYKWFEYPGPARADAAGTRLLQQTAPINGTPARLSLDFRTHQTSPKTVDLSYSLLASDPTDFVGVAATLKPAPGTRITATFDDNSQGSIDWEKAGAIAKPVRRLSIELAGDTYTLDLSQPRVAETYWGELRLWLAKEKIPGKTAVDTTLTLTCPDKTKFYPRDADAAVTDITPDWFPYPVAMAGTPVDLSFLNKDKDGHFIPAGAHGFLQVKGDQFVFQDGTPARFWGANITAAAALGSYQRSAQLADRLARMGCNIVRLHHLDSDWSPNIIDTTSADGTTQHLDGADMRKLDRLIFELKSRGIYVILDPWVGRSYRPGDNVPGSDKFQNGNFGLHPYIFFDAHMRDLHKLFLRQVWTHVNEFTGLAYKDDPAFATTECANEALFDLPKDMPDPYRTELVQLYTRWCAANNLDPGQPDDIVKLNYPEKHQRFYQSLMHDFYADIRKYLKEDVGLKIPINSSNWFHWPWEIGAQADGDFMDSHHYYHGNRIGPTSAMGGLWTQNPVTNGDTPFSTISAMAVSSSFTPPPISGVVSSADHVPHAGAERSAAPDSSLFGKPLTSSECGDNPPQTYRSSYYVGLAAIACLQGYDSLTPYAYSQAPEPYGHLSNFEMESDPATVASLAAGALIYRRGDVQPAKDLAVMLLPKEEQYAMHWENGYDKAFDHTPQFRAMVETHRVAIVYGDSLPPNCPTPAVTMTPATSFSYKHPDTQLLSDTGEIWRDWSRGVGLINTPRTQAAYGLLAQTPISTSDTTFNISTPFATCSLSSLTTDPIKTSNHLILTTVARAEDSNQTYNLSRTRLVTSGKPPVLAEPVTGAITFTTTAKSLTAHPLLPTGIPGPAIPLTVKDGKATLELKAAYKTLFYDITAAP